MKAINIVGIENNVVSGLLVHQEAEQFQQHLSVVLVGLVPAIVQCDYLAFQRTLSYFPQQNSHLCYPIWLSFYAVTHLPYYLCILLPPKK